MKRLTLLFAALALFASSAFAWESTPTSQLEDSAIRDLVIIAGIDPDVLRKVQEAVDLARRDKSTKVLRVMITSPGGDAFSSFASAILLRQLNDEGKVRVETYAVGLCASGCTWILAAGGPGYRTIDRYTVFLVHPVQAGGCVTIEEQPKGEKAKMMNAILEMARDLYIKFTGQPQAEVERWLSCGFEQIGNGELAVKLKLADKVVDRMK